MIHFSDSVGKVMFAFLTCVYLQGQLHLTIASELSLLPSVLCPAQSRSWIHGSHYACTLEKLELPFHQLFEFHFKTGGVCVGSVCPALNVTIRER